MAFEPTQLDIDTFRKIEEEACFGRPVEEGELRFEEYLAAKRLAEQGFLNHASGEFEITMDGAEFFADYGR